jgi:hypothetical protein
MGMFGSRGGLRFVVPVKADFKENSLDGACLEEPTVARAELGHPEPFVDLRRTRASSSPEMHSENDLVSGS